VFGARARVLRPPRCPATSGGGASTETAVPLPFTATQPVEAMLFDLQSAHRRARYFLHIPIQFLL
jgi:hypothetical protein